MGDLKAINKCVNQLIYSVHWISTFLTAGKYDNRKCRERRIKKDRKKDHLEKTEVMTNKIKTLPTL